MNIVTRALFTLLLAEITLGGGGRLLTLGPVSLRMILFALALLVTVAQLVRGERIAREHTILLLFFAVTIAIGLIRGISGGAQRVFWWEDVKPLLYFLVLPFFTLGVNNRKAVVHAANIIKFSALILAIAFLLVLLLIHTHAIAFLDFYHAVLKTEEFFFRGELTFFYKGFLYLCIGFIFLHFTGGKHKNLRMALVLIAIVLTFTRGFLLALCLTYGLFFFLNFKRYRVYAAILGLAALLIVFRGQSIVEYVSVGIDYIKNADRAVTTSADPQQTDIEEARRKSLLGNRDHSDTGRLQQIREVMSSITPVSFFIGHGFGHGIPARPVHMEISYLEIFHKQGIVGLLFWGYILLLLFRRYRAGEQTALSNAFFFGGIFVFFQSLTNQYINNPIGLAMVLLAIVSLDRIHELPSSREEKSLS